MARRTVRRFARADTAEELLVNNGTGYRPSMLDDFKPYLPQRWGEGFTNATQLFDEITAHGYRGREERRSLLSTPLARRRACCPNRSSNRQQSGVSPAGS
ncbi:hypothetical protein ACFYTQ_24760 [Nocardia sp. NPDC004068]|uniref:hypothetical protein n=1 Tax=Nocardia sp. NPDC004068 TaxID=3364303 RepID=UPI003694655B